MESKPQSITDSRFGMSPAELAAYCRVSLPFVRLEIRRKKLKVHRFGRRIVIAQAEVERYIAEAATR